MKRRTLFTLSKGAGERYEEDRMGGMFEFLSDFYFWLSEKSRRNGWSDPKSGRRITGF